MYVCNAVFLKEQGPVIYICTYVLLYEARGSGLRREGTLVAYPSYVAWATVMLLDGFSGVVGSSGVMLWPSGNDEADALAT